MGSILTTSTETSKSEAQQRAIFEDSFTDNRNEWHQINNEDCVITIRNGKYAFDQKREKGCWATWQESGLEQFDQHKDFRIETAVRKVQGLESSDYGIMWGLKNLDNFYLLYISGEGYAYGKVNNGKWHDIIDWSPSQHIKQGNSTNTLSIEKSGNQLKFFINDHYVTGAPFESFFDNHIGFSVCSQVNIEIDHITIKQ